MREKGSGRSARSVWIALGSAAWLLQLACAGSKTSSNAESSGGFSGGGSSSAGSSGAGDCSPRHCDATTAPGVVTPTCACEEIYTTREDCSTAPSSAQRSTNGYLPDPPGWKYVKHDVTSPYGHFASSCVNGVIETPRCKVTSRIPPGQNAAYDFYDDGKVLIETRACLSCFDDVCLELARPPTDASGGRGGSDSGFGFRVVPSPDPSSGGSAGSDGSGSGSGGR
jgi:hypothetical protein